MYESRPEATIKQVAADLGVNPETLRNWVRAAGAGRPRGRRAEAPRRRGVSYLSLRDPHRPHMALPSICRGCAITVRDFLENLRTIWLYGDSRERSSVRGMSGSKSSAG
ncbi:hypothetical protein DMH25_44030 [Streptomyces sp. WAC 01325]|uniref:transposase n=1 Tax=Streptomyces sp. WAC 01325 TaxID=2203202 RepID=UPI000F894FC9|nr:transposase [Streptomyces sp. WAC 01325]RSM85905.1 hypothetical protein DMH25_44030 [Streptomyces sp. WAC 01325]